MLRWLYRGVVHLHPSGFRNRFGEEMLSIFEQQSRRMVALGMLWDCVLSLLRQWILRLRLWTDPPVHSVRPAVPIGMPSFSTLDTFRPRTSAMIHGVVLSAVLFCTTCIAIRYSWIHVLHVQIPQLSFEPHLQFPMNARPSGPREQASTASHQISPPGPIEKSDLISERLQVDVIPVEPTTLSPEPGKLGLAAKSASAAATPFRSVARVALLLQLYTGDYLSNSPRVEILIRIRQGQLWMEIEGQPRRSLSPTSQTRFVVEDTSDGWIEFVSDDKGTIQALEMNWNGQIIRAQRR